MQSKLSIFIEKATLIHGDRYNYSESIYITSMAPITIICKTHGQFTINRASCHINNAKTGCQQCGRQQIISKTTLVFDEFLERAMQLNGDKYLYEKVQETYKNTQSKITIICRQHGEFQQKVASHLQGKQCMKCKTDDSKTSKEEFIQRAIQIFGDIYDYSNLGQYDGLSSKVQIYCKVHQCFFEQRASNHVNLGRKCRKCAKNDPITTESFIKRSKLLFGNELFDYSQIGQINNGDSKIKLQCLKHNYAFQQKVQKHLSGQYSCKHCSGAQHSKGQIEWLNYAMIKDNIHIQHVLNGGEYKIPNTNYKVDGYCQTSNTIYEYQGGLYHSDPNIWSQI